MVKLAQGLYILLYALVAGVMWGTWLSLGRTMTQYDAATFLADGQHMISNLATVMPVLMISTGVLGLVMGVVLYWQRCPGAAWLTLAGVVLLGAVIAVTLAVNVPIDNEIKTWTATTLPPDWQEVRSRWSGFHTLRTFLSLVGLAMVIGSALAIDSVTRTANARHPLAHPASTGGPG